jgi:hypothetical protein
MFILIFVTIIIICICINNKEHFEVNDKLNSYIYPNVKFLIPKDFIIKEDKYMNFLSNLNSNIQDGINISDINIDKKILNTKEPVIFNKIDECVFKAINVCTKTDSSMYIISDKVFFPVKWIGPYKNDKLPMNVDLKCYNNIYNCCSKSLSY